MKNNNSKYVYLVNYTCKIFPCVHNILLRSQRSVGFSYLFLFFFSLFIIFYNRACTDLLNKPCDVCVFFFSRGAQLGTRARTQDAFINDFSYNHLYLLRNIVDIVYERTRSV